MLRKSRYLQTIKTENEFVIKPGQTHPKNATQNYPTIKFIDHAAIPCVPCATRNNRISMSRGVSHIITNYHKKSQLSFRIAVLKMHEITPCIQEILNQTKGGSPELRYES